MFGFTGLCTICYLSPQTFKANCPLQFVQLLVFFFSPSMYSWYPVDTASLENPSCLMISDNEWPVRNVLMICLRSKASKSGILLIPAIPTTNSEKPQCMLYMQLPQHPHLHMNDVQCYTICIVLTIPNLIALQCSIYAIKISEFMEGLLPNVY